MHKHKFKAATAAGVVALCLGGAAAAQTTCAEEIASLRDELGLPAEGISKDGSLAPLEQATDGGEGEPATAGMTGSEPSEDEGGENTVSKDGTTAPLEAGEDGASAIALSQPSAEAQQQDDADMSARHDALQRASVALEEGDEEACMAAIEEARGA